MTFTGDGFKLAPSAFGGSLLKSHPKVKRPLQTKFPMHLVLRANRGGMRLPKNFHSIHQIIFSTAQKYGIKIYSYANVGNHLHLLMKLSKTQLWAAFIRELSSRIAALVRGNQLKTQLSEQHIVPSDPQSKRPASLNSETNLTEKKCFWKHRPFTRIINGWKKAYLVMKNYIYLNKIEAEGHISRKEVKTLKDFRSLIFDGS